MSRHQRQRNRRFKRALGKVPSETLKYGVYFYMQVGKWSRHLSPIERVAVRRELARLGELGDEPGKE